MSNIVVLGAQNGDEGKGHITHNLSKDFDWVIRFNGGANAGHTIYRDGVKYVHNLMPSFDWRAPNVKAFLGAGMVIDLEQLHLEVQKLWNVNSDLPKRVYVDPDAFVVLPEHKETDKKLNAHIGSTNRGIGPAYTDKVSRKGLRIKDRMKDADTNRDQFFIKELQKMGVQFKHVLELKRKMEHVNLLFEGAQGIMLDINHGIYPYVSCSDCTVAGIPAAGFAFAKIDKVYGVAKCYTTKVGEGPFPTEIFGDEAEKLRSMGNEFGATTGRPRRVGYIDLPALDYACKKGGITHLIITKFDILDGLESVKMCISYKKTPVAPDDFFEAKPQYIDIEGWKNSKETSQLDEFISKVEAFTGCSVEFVSCGTDTKDILLR
jgi:adenylosuccinate synthase